MGPEGVGRGCEVDARGGRRRRRILVGDRRAVGLRRADASPAAELATSWLVACPSSPLGSGWVCCLGRLRIGRCALIDRAVTTRPAPSVRCRRRRCRVCRGSAAGASSSRRWPDRGDRGERGARRSRASLSVPAAAPPSGRRGPVETPACASGNPSCLCQRTVGRRRCLRGCSGRCEAGGVVVEGAVGAQRERGSPGVSLDPRSRAKAPGGRDSPREPSGKRQRPGEGPQARPRRRAAGFEGLEPGLQSFDLGEEAGVVVAGAASEAKYRDLEWHPRVGGLAHLHQRLADGLERPGQRGRAELAGQLLAQRLGVVVQVAERCPHRREERVAEQLDGVLTDRSRLPPELQAALDRSDRSC